MTYIQRWTQRQLLAEMQDKIRSPHADKVYVGKSYTKANLIDDLDKVIDVAFVDVEWTTH